MQPAGWFPDPSGAPGQFRFWDGSAWTESVSPDPNAPFPTPGQHPGGAAPGGGVPGGAAPGAGGPGGLPSLDSPPSSKRLPLLIGAGVLALVLIAASIVFIMTRGDGPTADPMPDPKPHPSQAEPSEDGGTGDEDGTGGEDGEQDGPIDCEAGNGAAIPVQKGVETQTAGVVFQMPEEYTFRPQSTYFSYLNDVAARIESGDQQSGMWVGGLPTKAGFADQKQASIDLYECLTASSDSDAGLQEFQIQDTTEGQVGAVPAVSTTAIAKYRDAPDALYTVHILDAGQQGSWTAVVTFQPTDDEERAKILDEALESFRA